MMENAKTLTPAEMKILIASWRLGHSGQVANEMGISQQTVKNHLASIHAKLEVTTTLEATHRVFGGDHPVPLAEAIRALKIIRDHASTALEVE